MALTTVQMHDYFAQLIDEVATGRFSTVQIDRFLNLSILDIVDDRIDNIKNDKPYGVQSVQRVRDELRTIVKTTTTLTIATTAFEPDYIISYPTDYRYGLLLEVSIGGVMYTSVPKTYDWIGGNKFNPHTKPSPTRVRHIESDDKINVYTGGGVIASGQLIYVKNPTTVSFTTPTNTDLPGNLHEEIVRKASVMALQQMEDINKAVGIEKDEQNS